MPEEGGMDTQSPVPEGARWHCKGKSNFLILRT